MAEFERIPVKVDAFCLPFPITLHKQDGDMRGERGDWLVIRNDTHWHIVDGAEYADLYRAKSEAARKALERLGRQR